VPGALEHHLQMRHVARAKWRSTFGPPEPFGGPKFLDSGLLIIFVIVRWVRARDIIVTAAVARAEEQCAVSDA
jgi:hypothetical protein